MKARNIEELFGGVKHVGWGRICIGCKEFKNWTKRCFKNLLKFTLKGINCSRYNELVKSNLIMVHSSN